MASNYSKTIICLANSRKMTGRCVAGKEIAGGKIGGWIRPVSVRPAGELSEEDRRFQNGQDPKLLDVIRIPMIEHRPYGFQKENQLLTTVTIGPKNARRHGANCRRRLIRCLDPCGLIHRLATVD